MYKRLIFILFLLIPQLIEGQAKALEMLLADSSMQHSSVSICILNTSNGETVFDYNANKSYIPASVMKLLTSAAALELLGPEYRFRTKIGYTGTLNKITGRLTGDIIITGGGDPALGSEYFKVQYHDFLKNWIVEIRNLGIKKVEGRIITDDSRYDYQPVPAKWLWEDSGNYYGAGAYGLSVFDNTFEIHFRTSFDGSTPLITGIVPEICRYELSNQLTASGNSNKGYVFAAPYNYYGWLAGYIPSNREDFVLKASINDPPLLLAKIIDSMLDSAGIKVTGNPSTARLETNLKDNDLEIIAEVVSPPLKDIIIVLNHESVNLFAEHLVKELGKIFAKNGCTAAGIEILYKFLDESGIDSGGMFFEDGSGMSPLDAITSRGLAELLLFMRTKGKYFNEFYTSFPDAGKEGTLKNYFKDPVFDSTFKAKSGSMTRVRSYAGYLKTMSGNDMAFSILINNYSGPSQKIITGIEEILKETILNKQD
jgi:D-alanyl-D-alanine carboxypeptidase/D-alanyl-D-alanine-endopeptidase (penicillin-binding protein 4)